MRDLPLDRPSALPEPSAGGGRDGRILHGEAEPPAGAEGV